MTPRNEIDECFAQADKLYQQEKYLRAFSHYNKLKSAVKNPIIELLVDSRMLLCKFKELVIPPELILSEASVLAGKLNSAIDSKCRLHSELTKMLHEVQELISHLNTGANKLYYLIETTENAAKRAKEQKLNRYSNIIGMDMSKEIYLLQYLNELYDKLLPRDSKNPALDDLCEIAATQYVDLALDESNSVIKKRHINDAIQKLNQAIKHWQILKSKNTDSVFMILIEAWQRYYDHADKDEERMQSLVSIEQIVKSDRFIRYMKKLERQDNQDELEMAEDIITWVKEKIKKITDSEAVIRDALLMPPPAKDYKEELNERRKRLREEPDELSIHTVARPAKIQRTTISFFHQSTSMNNKEKALKEICIDTGYDIFSSFT